MLATDALRHNLKILLIAAHISRFLDHDGAFDLRMGCRVPFLQSDSLIDAVGPVEAERWHNTLTARLVLKEALLRTVVINIGYHIVEDDDDQAEIPCESFQLL